MTFSEAAASGEDKQEALDKLGDKAVQVLQLLAFVSVSFLSILREIT